MKTKIISIRTDVAIAFLGACAFFYFINNSYAQVNAKPTKLVTSETTKSGKYQVSISQVNKNNGNYLFAVVVNTETGASETYRFDTESAVDGWEKYRAQLPVFNF